MDSITRQEQNPMQNARAGSFFFPTQAWAHSELLPYRIFYPVRKRRVEDSNL